MRGRRGQAADRVLIVRLSALGDVVHVLPLVDALRRAWPEAHLGWVVEDKAASLLAGHPQIDRLFVLPRGEIVSLLKRGRLLKAAWRLFAFLRELRAARYQLSIDAQSNLRSSLIALASGAARRIGFGRRYSKEKSYVLRTDRLEPEGTLLKVERNLELLRPLGVDVRGVRARLGSTPEAEAKADAFRAEVIGAGAPRSDGRGPLVVALHPGVSAFGAIKQWMPERFAELARALRDRVGARVVLTWGPGERTLAEGIRDAAAGAATLAPQTRSILELAALLRRCDVVVGSDTGPVHLAAAVGVPVVGLYGPKDPAVYGPWSAVVGRPAVTVWGRTHCSPCKLRVCPDVICMPTIGTEQVYAAVLEAAGLGEHPVRGAGGGGGGPA